MAGSREPAAGALQFGPSGRMRQGVETMATDEWAIEAQNLTRRFKKVVAVDGLNLSVSGEEIFGLVGPDGAGKTTTIRMLCDRELPGPGTGGRLTRSRGRADQAPHWRCGGKASTVWRFVGFREP
jgi:ABC-2 type transport system ATP-binding protein